MSHINIKIKRPRTFKTLIHDKINNRPNHPKTQKMQNQTHMPPPLKFPHLIQQMPLMITLLHIIKHIYYLLHIINHIHIIHITSNYQNADQEDNTSPPS